jgi:type IV pilus assembly protein PilB
MAHTPTDEERCRYGIPVETVAGIYRANPQGCESCGGYGYRGRTGVCALVVLDRNARQLPVGRPSGEQAGDDFERWGMTTLRREAVYKVLAGVTSLEEVDRGVDGVSE